MSPIDQHLKELLPEEWQYADRNIRPAFFYDDFFCVRYDRGELELRFNDLLVTTIPVPSTAGLERVHQALQALFAHLPRYDVRLVREHS